MNKVLLGALALTMGLTQACSKKRDGIDNAGEAAKNEVKYSELMTDWASENCVKSKILLASSVHYKIEYDFYGDAFVKRYNYYSDSDCTDLTARITYKGNTEITEGDEELGKHIDFLFRSVTVASLTDGGRIFLEAVDFCGQKKFPTGQEVDITATSSDLDCILQSSNDKTTYDRFVVSDDDRVLRLGTGFSEKSLNDQPEERADIESEENFLRR